MSELEALILLCKENILFLHPNAGYQLSDLKCITYHTSSANIHYLNAAIITTTPTHNDANEAVMRATVLARGRAGEGDGHVTLNMNVAALEDMLENVRDRVGFFATGLMGEHTDIHVADEGTTDARKHLNSGMSRMLVAQGRLMTGNEYSEVRQAGGHDDFQRAQEQAMEMEVEDQAGPVQVKQEHGRLVRIKQENRGRA